MSDRAPFKRRTYIIKKSLQVKMGLAMLFLFGLGALTVGWETYWSLNGLITQGIINDPVVISMMNKLRRVVIIKTSLILGFIWILGVLLSHYLAGPLYRLQIGLKALASGDYAHRIKLRRFDELKDLADDFNEAAQKIQDQLGKTDR